MVGLMVVKKACMMGEGWESLWGLLLVEQLVRLTAAAKGGRSAME